MIHTRGLTRHFRVKGEVVEAVGGIDLDVATGELVAFLGPNGAGKSTTLRMLTTLLAPTGGTAEVVGCDVVADPEGVRRRIGSIGQGNGAGHHQRVRDELVHQGRCYGLARADAAARADELLRSFSLEDLAGRVVNTLSGGQRRRLDIAMGMVHRPELLFLDEPSTGLDPQNRANLKDEIVRLRAEHGTTIVLTTHYLDEADALADRVVVVDHGRVIADDTPQRLKSHLVGVRMVVSAFDEDDAPAIAATVERLATACRAGSLCGAAALGGFGCASGLGRAHSVRIDGRDVIARVSGAPSLVPELLRTLDAAGTPVASTEVARATLDDVFLALTGRSLRESALAADDASARSVPAAPIPEEQAA